MDAVSGEAVSKYEPFRRYLQVQDEEQLTLSFDAVADIIGDTLPASARECAEWWANDGTHVEAKAWLDAGYQSACVSLLSETVTFIRVLARTP